MKQDSSLKFKTQSGLFRYLEALRPIARVNRNQPTKAESLFWKIVLKNDRTGYRFLRQKSLNRFILDFYCSKLLLAIEIDGSSHSNKESLDSERDQFLLNLGIKTIRYTNNQIFSNIKQIQIDLLAQIKLRETELKI
jgi:very-short-patch-repair endonuclease